jgi:hypothetical protein
MEAALQIYPNPFISGVKVKGLNNLVKDVSVYNLAGKKLMTLQLSPYVENEIDLSTLGSGVFIFCFRLEDGQVLTKKLLKS